LCLPRGSKCFGTVTANVTSPSVIRILGMIGCELGRQIRLVFYHGPVDGR
jgi:hypothetical protein